MGGLTCFSRPRTGFWWSAVFSRCPQLRISLVPKPQLGGVYSLGTSFFKTLSPCPGFGHARSRRRTKGTQAPRRLSGEAPRAQHTARRSLTHPAAQPALAQVTWPRSTQCAWRARCGRGFGSSACSHWAPGLPPRRLAEPRVLRRRVLARFAALAGVGGGVR